MNAPVQAPAPPAAGAANSARRPPPRTRPLYWSVRRELWENRSIYLAPLGVGAFVVCGLVVHGITMPSHLPGMLGTDPAAPGSAAMAYRLAAALMFVVVSITGAFYCLEALSGERRDRSIVFWKSLPVSDTTTVLAKALVPLVLLPLAAFAAAVAMQLALFLLSAATLLVQGHGAGALWSELRLLRMWPSILYALVAMTVWLAPLYAFLLLVSGWARRGAALWAVLPVLALAAIEKLSMDTGRVAAFVVHRLAGWWWEAFVVPPGRYIPFDPMHRVTPGAFFAQPEPWIGLAFAAACLAAAARLRRRRDPA